MRHTNCKFYSILKNEPQTISIFLQGYGYRIWRRTPLHKKFLAQYGKVHNRVFNLKDEISQFKNNKGKTHQFNNPGWMADFVFLADTSMHLNDLNLCLQAENFCKSKLGRYSK